MPEDNNRPTSESLERLPRAVATRIWLTRLILIWETLWPPLWPALGWIGVYFALSLFDLWLKVPGFVHAACLAGMVLATLFSLWFNFKNLRWPTQKDALRRHEKDNDLTHRPLTSFDETLIQGQGEPEIRALWQKHKERMSAQLRRTRLRPARASLGKKDPWALRTLVLLVVIVGGLNAGAQWKERLILGFQPSMAATIRANFSYEAWINPPAYTKIAPIFLTRNAALKAGSDQLYSVPENSILTARVTSGKGLASLKITALQSGKSQVVTTNESTDETSARGELTYRVTQDAKAALRHNGRALTQWTFDLLPDRPPAIALSDELKKSAHDALQISFAIRDDHGILEGAAHLKLAHNLEMGGKENFEILKVPLPLPSLRPKKVDETSFHDLTAHPWAGLPVTLELVAIDDPGQIGRSDPVEFRLPERAFTNPLALAIIEQRRNLAWLPSQWPEVAKALEVLTLVSDEVTADLTVYLGLRSAYWSLTSRTPTTSSEIEDVYSLLWDLALRIEDGERSLAERDLREVAKSLMDALARKADQSEIEALLQEYAQALERYLQAIGEEARQNLSELENLPPLMPDAKMLDSQALQELLASIADLARTGATQEARELLAELQRMLENIMPGMPGQMNPGETRMSDAIEKLSDMIGRQRALMDQTFQETGKQNSKALSRPQIQKTPLGPPGQPSPNAPSAPSGAFDSLSETQQGLGEELGDILSGLAQSSDGQTALSDANEAMRDAIEALDSAKGHSAMSAQKRAIDGLREGAANLAQELMESLAARGLMGSGQDGPQGRDPLGRQPGSSGSGLGDHIKVPDQTDLQRAREILQELQRRAGEQNRPDIELEYLDRLLKQF